MPNFSSLARLKVPEKFLWVGDGVCNVIFMSNPTVVLSLGWGFGKSCSSLLKILPSEELCLTYFPESAPKNCSKISHFLAILEPMSWFLVVCGDWLPDITVWWGTGSRYPASRQENIYHYLLTRVNNSFLIFYKGVRWFNFSQF